MRIFNKKIMGLGNRLFTSEGRAMAAAEREAAKAERAFKQGARGIEHEIKLAQLNARKEAWAEAANDPILKSDLIEDARQAARDQFKASLSSEVNVTDAAAKPKSWMARHKIMTGLGVLGAGGLAYNTFGGSGTPIPASGMSAEEAGAQAAIRDAMTQGYGPVRMGVPGTQITAANYDGPLMEGAALGRA
jgi:hypothetical protein